MNNFFNPNLDFPWNIMDNLYERGRKVLSISKNLVQLDPRISKLNLQKMAPYLYSVEYDKIDYDKISARMEVLRNFGCSAVRHGKWCGRNFDWYYDEAATFVIRVSSNESRYGSLGVGACYAGDTLTEEIANSMKWHQGYDILPGFTLDGVNDYGVSCSINVVPLGDKGITTGTNPGAEDLCQLSITRFVLDHASSVDEAVRMLREKNIYAPLKTLYDYHFMISDPGKTVIVEFPNNTMHVMSNDPSDEFDKIPNIETPIMTNFYLSDWDGELKTGFDVSGGIQPEETTLTKHAAGIERYAILKEGLGNVSSAEDMERLMCSAFYTQMYKRDTNPFWYSEYCMDWGEPYGDLTIYQPKEDFEVIVNRGIEVFEGTTREQGKTWYTAHTSVYDLEEKTLYLINNENSEKVYTIKL